MAILKHGALQPNDWLTVADDAALPEGKPAVVSLDRWLKERDTLIGRNSPIGVKLKSDQSPMAVAEDLDRLALIVLEFPKFTDGRGYSSARMIAERYGYKGEIRAVGDVLADQIPLMRRCGIEAFVVKHEPTRKALENGSLAQVNVFYQPVGKTEVPVGTRPFLRRAG